MFKSNTKLQINPQ